MGSRTVPQRFFPFVLVFEFWLRDRPGPEAWVLPERVPGIYDGLRGLRNPRDGSVSG